jgi:hypothetical protein
MKNGGFYSDYSFQINWVTTTLIWNRDSQINNLVYEYIF